MPKNNMSHKGKFHTEFLMCIFRFSVSGFFFFFFFMLGGQKPDVS
jgi:hypothetical protein